jgi:FKBP-type peptidyl-prolyl cis-trans isomerase 2
MAEMLRYAKVNSMEGEKVFLTGVNPLTGKHVTFIFERVDNVETLENLKHAFQNGLFIKFLVGKDSMHIVEEKSPKDREDSYFTFFSYCKPYGYNPLFSKN